MLEDLKLKKKYDGFLYLAESIRNPPKLSSHHHVELELNLVLRGSITYVVDGRRFTFRIRTLLWLFPEQEHQLVDRSDDAQYYVVVFKPSLVTASCRTNVYRELKSLYLQRNGVAHTVIEPNSFDLIRRTMETLMQDSLDADLLNREVGFGVKSTFCYEHHDPDGLNAGLRHLLLLCWRTHRTGKVLGTATPLHPAVLRAIQLLSERSEYSSLSTLARACGTSEAYLSRIFQKQIGVSLTRYRNSLRLSRFWEHYRQPSQKTLTESMYAAGFGSYPQFYKVFTQAYGRGPRASLRRISDSEDTIKSGR